MDDIPIHSESACVINLAEARMRLTGAKSETPSWVNDIKHCCSYARMLKAEHDAETACIDFDCLIREIEFWWEGPADIRSRIEATWKGWSTYRALIRHIAHLPASNRSQAQMKRAAIGNLWLRGDCEWSAVLRKACEGDDHLLPRSMKLGNRGPKPC